MISSSGIRYIALVSMNFVLLLWIISLFGLVFNLSSSVEIGIYNETPIPDPIKKNTIMSLCLPTAIQSDVFTNFGIPTGAGRCGGVQPIVKKIVGEPGDTISVTENGVIVNGTLLPNSTLSEVVIKGYDWGNIYKDYTLSSGEYFVLGDKHPDSLDSRYFGPVKKTWFIAALEPLWLI